MIHLTIDKDASIDRFANVLINKGLAASNLEGGGIEIIREFMLVTNNGAYSYSDGQNAHSIKVKEVAKGIHFPKGLRIRM
jgi:hypothetical protein